MALVILALAAGGVFALRAGSVAREAARAEAVESSRVRGWARSEGGAGVSAAYPAERWSGRVDAMREHIARAGVVPPEEGELEAATEFLGAASEALRGD